MKYGSIVCTFLFVSGVFLALGQMWFSLFEPELFWKLFITIVAFFFVGLVITLVSKEYLSEKEMKKKGYID
ncbi:MAG: hypothetical protein RBR08_06330 [Desulforegulaceae bacterium]|nr:hypothetical protein [Desulforegulaceae bacterium]